MISRNFFVLEQVAWSTPRRAVGKPNLCHRVDRPSFVDGRRRSAMLGIKARRNVVRSLVHARPRSSGLPTQCRST